MHKIIGDRIRTKRLEMRIIQKQLGIFLDVSQEQIHKYERGEESVPRFELMMLCKLFKVRIDYFTDL